MKEWVLIIILTSTGNNGVALEKITGFSDELQCEVSGLNIKEEYEKVYDGMIIGNNKKEIQTLCIGVK